MAHVKKSLFSSQPTSPLFSKPSGGQPLFGSKARKNREDLKSSPAQVHIFSCLTGSDVFHKIALLSRYHRNFLVENKKMITGAQKFEPNIDCYDFMNWNYAFSVFDLIKIRLKKQQQGPARQLTFTDNFNACKKLISFINMQNQTRSNTLLEISLNVDIAKHGENKKDIHSILNLQKAKTRLRQLHESSTFFTNY